MLVVGGGDSAVEAACTLGEEPGCRVTLSYRRESFSRIKRGNQERLDAAVAAGHVKLRTRTELAEILPDRVRLLTKGAPADATGEVLPNDAVFVFAGGVLPTQLLVDAGIVLERHYGKRVEVVAETALTV